MLGLLAAVALPLTPRVAAADTGATLTAVGTSDLSDSGLMPNVIQPAFERAYPQYTFRYLGTAAATSIGDAETGAQGPSLLIVHAPALEDGFVAGGYSYEAYGRALFTSDVVLAGPPSDPAGVAADGAHDVVRAFADVARAGMAGAATFVSGGGAEGPTVAEHAVWALVDSAHLAPSGLLLCAVSASLGGGETPIASGNGVSASGQPCPEGGALPPAPARPAWYAVTGLTPGPNVQAAGSCGQLSHSGPDSCYVLTDRGTYDYLASGADPAGAVSGLTIVSREDGATAAGDAGLLASNVHGYVVNPAKPGETVNLTAARDFLSLVTSPAVQAAIGAYLADTGDPGGAPFTPDASPVISMTGSGFPARYQAGRPITISGTATNAETGYPGLTGQPVSVAKVRGAAMVPVASSTIGSTGAFVLRFVPPSSGRYAVATPQITQIEDPGLNPPFGDILAPAATAPVRVTVHSALTALHVRSIGGAALVVGTVAPGTGHVNATVTVLARRGRRGRWRRVAVDRLGDADANFALAPALAAGRWHLRVEYRDGRNVIGSTRPASVTVAPPPPVGVRLSAVRVRRGRITVAGTVTGTVAGGGAVTVELTGLRTAGTRARFVRLGAAPVRGGAFTVHARLRRGARWILQVREVVTPASIGYSRPLTTITVR